MMQENPQEDGYVECSECGHEIDTHDHRGWQETDGINTCTCELPWTRQRIREYYREVGVPVRTGTIEDWDLS